MSADNYQEGEETRDYAKWIWLGIALMLAVMVAAMFFMLRKGDANRSVVHARHILIKFNPLEATERQQALGHISDLRKRLAAGEDFSALAKEWSQDSGSAARGGDLGYQFKGAFEANFEEQAWSLPVGEISDVVETKNGFHILQVIERNFSKMDQYQIEIEKEADELLKNKQP